MAQLRWQVVDDSPGQPALFEETRWHEGRGEYRGLEFLHVRAKSIINSLPPDSPLPFRHTINAYRGCSHACVFCFARPTHTYLDLNPGVDFERRIVVKVNAVERLRAELHPRRWAGDPIAMGTNTDPYQRCEGKYRLTRGIVEVLDSFANPFSILTKSTLILRDLDVLCAAATRTTVSASFSIGTLDPAVWRATEPGTPHPLKRMEAVARLNEAGIPCGVLMGPVIPGLSDRPEQIDEVVRTAIDAGATSIAPITLHLRPGVKGVFMEWLEGYDAELFARYQALYPRSYAPQRTQERISALVADALERHGRPRQQCPSRAPQLRSPRATQPAAQMPLWS